MAGHLLTAGRTVHVWNRTPGKADQLAEKGAIVEPNLKSLGASCPVVCLCVGRTEDVEECALAVAEGMGEGGLIVDHSTIEPDGARRIAARLAEKGIRFVDAPITGGSVGAQRGQLTIFMGGAAEDVAPAKEIVAAYAKRAERVGDVGQGQMTKLANQIAVGGALSGVCEALAFAEKAGLDLSLTRELIAGGAGGSWAFEFYGPKILARDWTPGFSVKNQRKDFGYCAKAADSIGAAIPTTILLDELLSRLEIDGRGELTTAALFDVLLEMGRE